MVVLFISCNPNPDKQEIRHEVKLALTTKFETRHEVKLALNKSKI